MPEDKPTKEQIQRESVVREDKAKLTDDQFRQKYDIRDTTKAPTPGNKGKN